MIINKNTFSQIRRVQKDCHRKGRDFHWQSWIRKDSQKKEWWSWIRRDFHRQWWIRRGSDIENGCTQIKISECENKIWY